MAGAVTDREWTAEEARESLSPMARAFAERYPGPPRGTETALAVGYARKLQAEDPEAARRTASSRTAKLLRDPRVQAILLERRDAGAYSGPIGSEREWSDPSEAVVPPDQTRGPATQAGSSADYLREVMNNDQFPIGERTKAAGHLRQIEKEEARIARDSGENKLTELRRKTTAILAAKRAREGSER